MERSDETGTSRLIITKRLVSMSLFKKVVYPLSLAFVVAFLGKLFYNYKFKEKHFYPRLKNRKRRPCYKLSDIRVINSNVWAVLTNTSTKKEFVLLLRFLTDEIISISINDPIFLRHVVRHSIILQPQSPEVGVIVTQDFGKFSIKCQSILIRINLMSFCIEVFRENDLLLTMNSRNFLQIEESEPNVALCADFFFPDALNAYGLPQHAESFALKPEKTYRLYNVDRFGYSTQKNDSLYGSVPILYGLGARKAVGVLWLNASETFVDLDCNEKGINASFLSESGALEAYFLTGPTLKECVRQNSQLTGRYLPKYPLNQIKNKNKKGNR